MKATVKITRNELISMLLNWNFGAQPASIQYVTEPKLTKDGKNLFGTVTKVANVGVMIGYCYENSVNNQLEREQKTADFMAAQLWNGKGKRLSLALSTHTEKQSFYLTYKSQQTFKAFHFDSNLNLIANDVIKAYFPTTNYSSQGVDKAIMHREISIDNIRKLKFKKTTYEVV